MEFTQAVARHPNGNLYVELLELAPDSWGCGGGWTLVVTGPEWRCHGQFPVTRSGYRAARSTARRLARAAWAGRNTERYWDSTLVRIFGTPDGGVLRGWPNTRPQCGGVA